jgi:hypothetical protein
MTAGPQPSGDWSPEIESLTIAGARIRVDGVDYPATVNQRQAASSPQGESLSYTGSWSIGSGGQVRYDWIRFDQDPQAWWVEVTVSFPTLDAEQLEWFEEAVPIQINLPPGKSWSVTRPLATSEVASYEVTRPYDALNSHAANGWLLLQTQGATSGVSITTQAMMRSAPAFMPLRFVATDDGQLEPQLVPFGTLWGELLDHQSLNLLGSGAGEYVTRLTSPQLKPTAPAWNGQSTCFILRIQPETTPADFERLNNARDGVLILADLQPAWPTGCF